MNPIDRAGSIKEYALSLGFSSVGIADLSPNVHGEHLLNWLACGMAGTMTYMHRQAKRRLEPARILPGADRAVVVLCNHFNVDPPYALGTGRVAKYARGPDYHEVLRTPLQRLCNFVTSLGDNETIARAYVDAGPVPERELAQRAGLGWIGRNTMLINPRAGSFVFVATVLTNLDVEVDRPYAADRCGSCQLCIESCPTGAIKAERLLDSRRCISYLTIEYKGGISEGLQPLMGDWIFGCDVCQDVCPWNRKFAKAADSSLVLTDRSMAKIEAQSLLHMTAESFLSRFGKTALNRPGLAAMQRIAHIVIRNARSVDKGAAGP